MDDPIFPAEWLRAERLTTDFLGPVHRLWRPLAKLVQTRQTERGGMLVVGLCGPQGSGKSTGAMALHRLLGAARLNVAALSIDDLYLGHAERQRLGETVHPLLATRGPPGTHEPDLGVRVLTDLAKTGETRLPRFDKAQDDRAPEPDWPVVVGPAEVAIFEGWCVGARPQPDEALAAPINALEAERDPDGVWRRYVNDALAERYPPLFDRIDLLIQLRAPSFEVVTGWRTEQEHKLRARQGDDAARTMSDAEVARFVQYYERLSRHIDAEMPGRAEVVVQLDDERGVTSVRGVG